MAVVETRRRVAGWPLLVVLAVALLVVVLVAAGSGQVEIPPLEVLGSFVHGVGLDLGPLPTHPQGDNALWAVRFPRVALAVVVGACLAVAGASLQGVFGNPLAEPAVVGVSSGAAVGACTVIVLGVSVFGNLTIAVAAFTGGLVTTLLVYALARSGGRTEVVTLVLTGIAVNDVSLTLSAGEVVAVVGPNGAGKSTLVSVLAGDLPPVSGSVVVDGRPVGRWRPRELASRRSVLPSTRRSRSRSPSRRRWRWAGRRGPARRRRPRTNGPSSRPWP